MENIELLSLFRVYKQVPQMQKDGRIVTNGTLYTVFKKNHWQRHIMLSQLLEQRLRIWSHLLKKSVMEGFIFCAVYVRRRLANTQGTRSHTRKSLCLF